MAAGTVTGKVLTSPKILIGGYDVTGYHNKISAPISKEILDAQQFGATGRQRKAGLWDLVMTHSGYWDGGATTIDAVLRGLPASNVLTLCPNSGAMGEQAWFCNIITPKYETGGKVGGFTTFMGVAALQDGSPVLNGTILKAAEITESGTGTAYELGAVTTGSIYAALHVTATSGNANRTLDVIIQSAAADDPTFVSPTTRMTFTQVTTSVGAEFLTPVAGAVSDTLWRASYTRGGTTGTFTMYVIFAIL